MGSIEDFLNPTKDANYVAANSNPILGANNDAMVNGNTINSSFGLDNLMGNFDLGNLMSSGLGTLNKDIIGSAMTKNKAATGLGGWTSALDSAMGLFNTYDKYKTNSLNRDLAKQQISNNATEMANRDWNRTGLHSAFGLGPTIPNALTNRTE